VPSGMRVLRMGLYGEQLLGAGIVGFPARFKCPFYLHWLTVQKRYPFSANHAIYKQCATHICISLLTLRAAARLDCVLLSVQCLRVGQLGHRVPQQWARGVPV
jgi:hypothetical protein